MSAPGLSVERPCTICLAAADGDALPLAAVVRMRAKRPTVCLCPPESPMSVHRWGHLRTLSGCYDQRSKCRRTRRRGDRHPDTQRGRQTRKPTHGCGEP